MREVAAGGRAPLILPAQSPAESSAAPVAPVPVPAEAVGLVEKVAVEEADVKVIDKC